MRRQNSTFKTGFISEAGSELKNHDYFAFVELEDYACYVIADGLNDMPDADSARLATQTIILAFQARPSMKKRAIRSYLEAADRALAKADGRERLKASATVVVTDYARLRYGYAGNTRLRLYRDGHVTEETRDMSLGSDLARERELPGDTLSRHEERNNLFSYLGQGAGFAPAVSKRIRLNNGDIAALYTRGIWENLDSGELDDVFSEAKDDPKECLDLAEDLLLSKQPSRLENYTLAAVFADKVFQDPNRKRRIRKAIAVSVTVLSVTLTVGLVAWMFMRQRRKQTEEMQRRYANTIEYIQDANFIRAGEECEKALGLAEKLKLKKPLKELSDYQKLIEAVNTAEDSFGGGRYEEAQAAYVTAKERSRYADRLADAYIDKRLEAITDYLSVFDYIQLGDTLAAQGDFARAEEKYLQAKSLATRTYFEEGRKDALDCLDALYESRQKAEEADTKQAKEKAVNETGAAQLAAEGDKAFAEGDYESAGAYYAMALEKYLDMGDEAHADLIRTKIGSSGQKSEENQEKERQAAEYEQAAKTQEALGNEMEAKKQYLFAKNAYRELKMDDKAAEIDGRLAVLELEIERKKDDEETAGEEMGDGGEKKEGGMDGPGGDGGKEEEQETGDSGGPAGGRKENGEE